MGLEIHIRCNICGQDITYQPKQDTWGDVILEVDPCEDCLEEVRIEEYQRGLEEGESRAS